MLSAVVVLHLITWDCDTGLMLQKSVHYFLQREVASDTIEDCRRFGVAAARLLSRDWRARGHGNASSNVDCEWVRGGAPA